MQKQQRIFLLTALAIAGGVGLWLVATLGMSALALPEPKRSEWIELLQSVAPLLILAWVLGSAALLAAWQRWVAPAARVLGQLAEQTRVISAAQNLPETLTEPSYAPAKPLANAIRQLAAQRDDLRQDMAEQVRQTSGRLQQEKDHLAALLAELQQCVLVCNLEGRILLYNHLAQQQLGRPKEGISVGIGRSIEWLLDRTLLRHALSRVQQRLDKGDANPATHFITHTPAKQLLRVQMSPVLDSSTQGVMSGFVLLLEDVTSSFEQEAQRDHLLHSLTEGNRASLAATRAAVEMLGYEDISPAMRERFLGIVHEESERMSQRIDELARRAASEVSTRWPLEDMLGEDFIAAAKHHLEGHLQLPIEISPVQPTEMWLRVDGYSLLQALAYLGQRLKNEFEVSSLNLRLQSAATQATQDGTHGETAKRAHLDLIWRGQALSTETVMGWEMDNIEIGAERSTLTVRDVISRHDGEMWFERDRASHTGFLRFLLPQGHAREEAAPINQAAASSIASVAATAAVVQSRPEFYDFDLFVGQDPSSKLDDLPLTSLRYTVFDTETTGLNPSDGDQIIQIGAVRIVNGRVLMHENFDRLINPERLIPEAGIPIHGITQQMVQGQPTITEVLPAFHRFAEDSVLVAHNAAFDMKFLQLLEERTGVVFRQPVLDTLLLSAVAHPSQESHRLEALAERFGVTVLGRHTGLGDALVTAQVWLHLVQQLQEMGIHTLAQARHAAQQTYYARLKY